LCLAQPLNGIGAKLVHRCAAFLLGRCFDCIDFKSKRVAQTLRQVISLENCSNPPTARNAPQLTQRLIWGASDPRKYSLGAPGMPLGNFGSGRARSAAWILPLDSSLIYAPPQ
jgi:hypothetical protein